MRLKTMILTSFFGLACLINYGCGFHIGAGIGKADRDMKDQRYAVNYPIEKNNKRVSQAD